MHYRLYGLNPTTGRIMQGRDIVAETDADALAEGRAVHAHAPFELWCGSRHVFSSATADKSATG